jgi:cell division protein FtsA
MGQLITALDIGSANIKGLVVELRKDSAFSVITVFQQPSAGLRRGVIVDVEEVTSVLRSLIVDLQKISKKAVQNIFVNLNSDQVKPRLSRGTAAVARADQEIQQDDVERAVQASRAVKVSANSLILHNITREFIVDDVGGIPDPVGMIGSRVETNTLVIEAFAPHFYTLTRAIERVGGRVSGVVFSPLAAARAVLSKRQRELGVLMIDFGFGTTSIAVYEENKVLHAKSLPVGSTYLTNDIAIGLRAPVEAAEKLKLTYGYAVSKDVSRREVINLQEIDSSLRVEISRRFLAEVIEVRLAEILGLINNELKALGHIELPAGVVMVGGGVKLKGLVDLVRQELKLTVQMGLPDLSRFEIANPTNHELLDDPSFATAVGLVLWGAERVGSKPGSSIIDFFKNLFP